MKGRLDSHIFWGSHSPLSSFSAVALIILASSRLAFALVSAGAIIWVYGLSALIFSGARRIMPGRGKMVILIFLSAFLCGIFMMLLGVLNPLIVLGTGFFLFLVPLCLIGSGLFEASEHAETVEFFSRAFLEGCVLALVIITFALIREPLGMGTLSFPGGPQGFFEIFGDPDTDAFVPARILSASAGGLLLLGYLTALFRYLRERSGGAPRDDFQEEGQ